MALLRGFSIYNDSNNSEVFMFIDDSQAQAILRNTIRDAQDSQNRARNKLLVTSFGKGKKRNKKILTRYFSELSDGTNKLVINTFESDEKHFTAGASFVDPVLCKFDGLGNIGRLTHHSARSKEYIKTGEFFEIGFFIGASEHFMLRSIQRMKSFSLAESLSVCEGLLRMIAKSKLTLDSYPDDTYLVIDGFAIPLAKFLHKKLNFPLLVLKTVLCKNRMTPNQLKFFGDSFDRIDKGEYSIILLDHNGSTLSQLTESEGSLSNKFCSFIEADDFLYLVRNWAMTEELIKNRIDNRYSIKQIEDNMIEASRKLSSTEGLVLLSKSQLSKSMNDEYKSIVPKAAHSR